MNFMDLLKIQPLKRKIYFSILLASVIILLLEDVKFINFDGLPDYAWVLGVIIAVTACAFFLVDVVASAIGACRQLCLKKKDSNLYRYSMLCEQTFNLICQCERVQKRRVHWSYREEHRELSRNLNAHYLSLKKSGFKAPEINLDDEWFDVGVHRNYLEQLHPLLEAKHIKEAKVMAAKICREIVETQTDN